MQGQAVERVNKRVRGKQSVREIQRVRVMERENERTVVEFHDHPHLRKEHKLLLEGFPLERKLWREVS